MAHAGRSAPLLDKWSVPLSDSEVRNLRGRFHAEERRRNNTSPLRASLASSKVLHSLEKFVCTVLCDRHYCTMKDSYLTTS
jgi:hypothetical protein